MLPFCKDCHYENAMDIQYDNLDFKNLICHKCGKKADLRKTIPFCKNCEPDITDSTDKLENEWNHKNNKRVLVVAGGRFGEEIASNCQLYFCQNTRSFRPSGYISFYSKGKIKYCYKLNKGPKRDQYLLNYKCIKDYFQAKNIVDKNSIILKEDFSWINEPLQIFKLGEAEKIKVIQNVEKDKNQKPTAYTQGHRYTEYSKIKSAEKTSEL